jgi:asparagine synthase (glutamine-hydrolysing)
MLESMRHEGFYNTGQYVNEDLGVYAGWVCHKESFSDCMPLVSATSEVVLIFHGENHLACETGVPLLGAHCGVSASNARHVLDLYTQRGDDFLVDLNGWYCGVIADSGRKRVTLFNDRYGMGRVYFHETKDEFIFASEAKALLRIRPHLRSIDLESIADYLRYNCITGDKSLFKGVSLLPHASRFDFENGTVAKRRRYFDFSEWEAQPTLDHDEFHSRFNETVKKVFPIYARGAENVALSLTAGLDTRLVMGALGKCNGNYSCYTFGGHWGELYDVRVARKLAKLYGKAFESILINNHFLRNFGSYATKAVYISDGTYEAFGAHDVFFNQIAREIAPIRLTGKFGSEVVRIRKLVDSLRYPDGLLSRELESKVRELAPFADQNPSGHPLTRVVTEEIPWHEFGRNYVEQSQLVLRTPYMDNVLVKLMYTAPNGIRSTTDLQEDYIRRNNPEISSVPTNMGRLVSRNAAITKLMDVWYRGLFKMEYVYLFATPHWLTRIDRALPQLKMEQVLAGRQKWEGYRIWIKTDFADFIRGTLFNTKAQFDRYFRRKTVERMVNRHIAGTHNYLNEINKVLTIELVCSSLLRE